VTVVIADDEPMFRASLRHLLAVPPSVIREVYGVDVGAGFDVIGEAGSGEETIATVRRANPALLLLDLSMPRLSGLDVARELLSGSHAPPTVMLTGGIDQPHLAAAIQIGVRGLVMKHATTELLFEAIMCVLSGRRWLDKALVGDLMELVGTSTPQSAGIAMQSFGLTRREREVVSLVVAGDGNKEIARKCAVSEETVKHHLTRIFSKVGASNRLELALVATRRGLVSDMAHDA
jgi:two-component system, NarL family, nitrate/nitrite response regulator NarL